VAVTTRAAAVTELCEKLYSSFLPFFFSACFVRYLVFLDTVRFWMDGRMEKYEERESNVPLQLGSVRPFCAPHFDRRAAELERTMRSACVLRA
jgi:hypothetical protein